MFGPLFFALDDYTDERCFILEIFPSREMMLQHSFRECMFRIAVTMQPTYNYALYLLHR